MLDLIDDDTHPYCWRWKIGPILDVYGMRLMRDHGDPRAADDMASLFQRLTIGS
jgi:hypothetical protein